jgi:hypothetical protein
MHHQLAVDGDVAAGGFDHASQNAGEGALAGASFADDGEGLTHFEI